jgi:hypothetical protein
MLGQALEPFIEGVVRHFAINIAVNYKLCGERDEEIGTFHLPEMSGLSAQIGQPQTSQSRAHYQYLQNLAAVLQESFFGRAKFISLCSHYCLCIIESPSPAQSLFADVLEALFTENEQLEYVPIGEALYPTHTATQ